MTIKEYNGLVIKDVWHPGDSSKRPKPDRIIIGIGENMKHYIRHIKTVCRKPLKRVPEGDIDKHRPVWHAFVYGSKRRKY